MVKKEKVAVEAKKVRKSWKWVVYGAGGLILAGVFIGGLIWWNME